MLDHLRTCSRVICRGQRSVWWPLKSAEVWSFDLRLRVGITAIEAQQKMQVSRSGYAKPLWPYITCPL